MESYKKIIVNADDFGYRKEINKGIIYAYKNGIVKSTTVLTHRDAFDDAVSLAKENPELKTGLHIDLDDFFEVVRPKGHITNFKIENPQKQQISDAIDRQLDKFLSAGLHLTHFDGHHHAHQHPFVLPVVAGKAKELNAAVRFFPGFYNDDNLANEMRQILNDLSVRYCPHFINGWYWGNIDEDFELAELMTHPGFNELWREYETAKSCDPNLIKYIKDKNIELITYDQI